MAEIIKINDNTWDLIVVTKTPHGLYKWYG